MNKSHSLRYFFFIQNFRYIFFHTHISLNWCHPWDRTLVYHWFTFPSKLGTHFRYVSSCKAGMFYMSGMLCVSVSFLFNWLGFLLSLCLSNTVAGRCGALSGLGLSIIKWVAIVKVRTRFVLAFCLVALFYLCLGGNTYATVSN